MPFERPSLVDLVSRTTQDLVSRLELPGSVLRRAVVRVLARVTAGAVHGLHGHLDWSARQLFAVTADTGELDLHGLDYGITRTPGAFAAGTLTFTGADGAVIPAGTLVQRGDGLQVRTQADATIASGTAAVAVVALTSGADGNSAAGTSFSLVSPIAAVIATATVAAGGLTNGVDPESDEGYRSRILERKRNVPQGGALADYLRWTREVPGVTRAFVYPQWMGPGTVGVTFVQDDEDPIIPDAPKVAQVQAYLDDATRRPVTAVVVVFAPVAVAVNLTLSVTPDSAAIRAAITSELVDLFARTGAPGITVRRSKLSEAVSIAAGEDSHTLTAPASDIALAANELPVLGVITWL